MANKTKTSKTAMDQINDATQNAGLLLMTAAVTLGMVELPEHLNNRIVIPNQPSYAQVGNNVQNDNTLRREREESAPHYISYSTVQRTPSRTGKR